MNNNSEQPAFSAMASSANGTRATQVGLTKREYFAGLAMQGFLASGAGVISEVIKQSVEISDLLLAELDINKQP